jgi:hypothetical protein
VIFVCRDADFLDSLGDDDEIVARSDDDRLVGDVRHVVGAADVDGQFEAVVTHGRSPDDHGTVAGPLVGRGGGTVRGEGPDQALGACRVAAVSRDHLVARQ